MGRAPCCEKVGLNRGPWTREEDLRLIHYIESHGEGCWRTLPKAAGLLRCGKSCRLRWINYLRPDLKRGNITEEEDRIIIKLHSCVGNRWSVIAGQLPGRTDNEIKNYWNTHLKKKLRNMGLDPQTHLPIQSTVTANINPSASKPIPDQSISSLNLQKMNITEKTAGKNANIHDERYSSFNFGDAQRNPSSGLKTMNAPILDSCCGIQDIVYRIKQDHPFETSCYLKQANNYNSSITTSFDLSHLYPSPATIAGSAITAQRGAVDNYNETSENTVNNSSYLQLCNSIPSTTLSNLIDNELFWNTELLSMQHPVKLEQEAEEEDSSLALSESVSSDLWDL